MKKRATTYRLPCGCEFDQSQWLKLCAPHQQEHDDIHRRWQHERDALFAPPKVPEEAA